MLGQVQAPSCEAGASAQLNHPNHGDTFLSHLRAVTIRKFGNLLLPKSKNTPTMPTLPDRPTRLGSSNTAASCTLTFA